MKFCMVTTFYPPYHFGGDATYIYRLSNALAQRGHDVDVIHDRDAYSLAHPGEPAASYENHPRVTVHALKSRAGFLSPLATQQTGQPWFKSQIKKLLETQRYDVIHFHNISLIGPGALAYGNATKLMTLHEHWLICPMHILWRFDRQVCARRTCLLCTLHGKRPPQWWRYTNFLDRQLQHIDQFISPSRFTREKHLEIKPGLPITVLPYFVPPIPESSDDPPPPTRPYFIFVGRLVKIKGLQTLFPVFKNYPHADLLVVGEGEYASRLREGAREIPNVKFLGALAPTRLRALYRHALAVIMPSICYEVLGIVQLEAFAVKTPVIARALGGMPEPIQDSNGGLIYRTDPELVAAMKRLQENPTLRNTLGENGYAGYLKLWSAQAHLEKYFELIAKLGERNGEP